MCNFEDQVECGGSGGGGQDDGNSTVLPPVTGGGGVSMTPTINNADLQRIVPLLGNLDSGLQDLLDVYMCAQCGGCMQPAPRACALLALP